MVDPSFRIRAGSTEQPVKGTPGNVLTFQSDGTLRGEPPASGGGAPLTAEWWVDPARVGSTQDGSEGNPFLTPQAAYDALVLAGLTGTLLLAAGDYGALGLSVAGDVAIVAPGNPVFLGLGLTIAGGTVFMRGVLAVVAVDGSADCQVQNCTWATGSTLGDASVTAKASVFGAMTGTGVANQYELADCVLSSLDDPNAIIRARDCQVGGAIAAAQLECWDVVSQGAITAPIVLLNQTDVAGIVTAATLLEADSYSLQELRRSGQVHVVAATRVTDRPVTTGKVFAVPALAGVTGDVTVAFVGAKPGDMFVLESAAPLAGVGHCEAWSPADDQLTVRFIGTTAGGNATYSVTQLTTSP
mgnify:CR=1 FL=1